MLSALSTLTANKGRSSLSLAKHALKEAVKNILFDLKNNLPSFSPGFWKDLEPEERLREIYFETACENFNIHQSIDELWDLLPDTAKREALDTIDTAMQNYPEPVYMNIPTGSIDTESNWDAENGQGTCRNNKLMLRVSWFEGEWLESDD